MFLIISFFILACSALSPAPRQPTRRPLPTLTPTPTFYRWDAAEIMRAIKAAGLEHQDAHLMTPEEYGEIPALAEQGVRFSIAPVCAGCNGVVLSFNNPAALETTKTYYLEATAESNPAMSSWVFEKDNILLQLSGQVPEAKALQYGTILVRLD